MLFRGIAPLKKNSLARQAAEKRGRGGFCGNCPATGANECDDRVGGAGAAKALFAFLETAVHAGGVESLFGFDGDRGGGFSPRGFPIRSRVAPDAPPPPNPCWGGGAANRAGRFRGRPGAGRAGGWAL